jgi:hypothetical protein
MDEAFEKKLRETVDRQEIWQVLQRYGRALDRLDVELAQSMYFEDAVDDHGHFIGRRDDFIEWANGTTRTMVDCHHGLMNHYCELDGDNAYCETYYLFIGVRETPPHLMTMGRYIDHFQRRNGEWRIANRVNLTEKLFDLPDCSMVYSIKEPYGPEMAQPIARDRSDVSYQRPVRPRPIPPGQG